MAGKSLRNILAGKTRNSDAEVYKQALELSPAYSAYNNGCFMLGEKRY